MMSSARTTGKMTGKTSRQLPSTLSISLLVILLSVLIPFFTPLLSLPFPFMLSGMLHRQVPIARARLASMTSTLSSGSTNNHSKNGLSTLAELPKSNVFTSKLPPDPAFETPESSDDAPRQSLGPRMVKDALYTYVRPEPTSEPELLGVSPRAMRDIGLRDGEEDTQEFRDLVSGNKIWWSKDGGGIYPWAQCYGGMWVHISPLWISVGLTSDRLAIVC